MTYLEAGLEVLKLIHMNGYEAYFVGGFVRDHILGVASNDIDIATNALPEQISNIFKVINSGIKYNCVTIKYDCYSFETTTYRLEEEYRDNRHPIYKVASTLSMDLKRRDFTINALAMDVDFNVIDLFDGLSDLKEGIIRTVNEPSKRFTEDALRMLRAAYFAAKLGFKIESDTLAGMRKCAYLIQNLSNDRIAWELEKIINSKHQMIGLNYLIETNIAPYLQTFKNGIYLISQKRLSDILWHDFLALSFYENISELRNINLKSDVVSDITTAIVFSKDNIKNKFSVNDVFEKGLKVCLLSNKLNVIFQKSKDNSSLINKIYQEMPIKKMSELAIKGQDILDNIELKEHKIIGQILLDVRNLVLNGKLSNEKELILAYIRKHYY